MTMTDDDLDRLLLDAGNELDSLSDDRVGHGDAHRRRPRRVWPAAAAAGLVAAAAAGLVILPRDDGRPAPAAPIATVAAPDVAPAPPPELPVVGSDTLPFEVLVAPPPGYRVTQYFSENVTQFPATYDGDAVLLGWGEGDVLVPVIVWPLADVETPGADARSAGDGDITGWIDGDENSSVAELDLGGGNAVEIEVLGPVPDGDILALANALDPASDELAWASALPGDFTQIGRQRPEVWQRAVFYADFDAEASIGYSAYSSFPLYMLALDPGSTITAVDGFAGAWTIDDAGMGGGVDSGRNTYWVGDDGIVRGYGSWSHNGGEPDDVTAADLEAVVAQVRPATAAERAQYGTGVG